MQGKMVYHTDNHKIVVSKAGYGPLLQFTAVYGFATEETKDKPSEQYFTKLQRCLARVNFKTKQLEWSPCLHFMPQGRKKSVPGVLGFSNNYQQFTSVTENISEKVMMSLRKSGAADVYEAEWHKWFEEEERLKAERRKNKPQQIEDLDKEALLED